MWFVGLLRQGSGSVQKIFWCFRFIGFGHFQPGYEIHRRQIRKKSSDYQCQELKDSNNIDFIACYLLFGLCHTSDAQGPKETRIGKGNDGSNLTMIMTYSIRSWRTKRLAADGLSGRYWWNMPEAVGYADYHSSLGLLHWRLVELCPGRPA